MLRFTHFEQPKYRGKKVYDESKSVKISWKRLQTTLSIHFVFMGGFWSLWHFRYTSQKWETTANASMYEYQYMDPTFPQFYASWQDVSTTIYPPALLPWMVVRSQWCVILKRWGLNSHSEVWCLFCTNHTYLWDISYFVMADFWRLLK